MTSVARAHDVRVGPLDRSHRTRLAEIVRATGAFSDDELAVALELFDDTYPGVGRPTPEHYRFLGAFTPDGELAGYACYGRTPATDRVWDLYWIAVHPAAQGTGSGTHLLSEVERRIADDEARMLVVETSSRSDYAGSRGFYARRGYLEAARVRDFYAPADDRILYVKRFHKRPAFGAGVQDDE
jgi:ribosomal protein S18 acetylase RimI-like enzyme